MINATEQAIEVTGEVIASFTRLRERTKEMERRYETIPPNQPRKAVFKLMLDDSKQRLGIQQEKVILLCYRWGMDAGQIAARIGVTEVEVNGVIAKNPDCRRLGAGMPGVFYA